MSFALKSSLLCLPRNYNVKHFCGLMEFVWYSSVAAIESNIAPKKVSERALSTFTFQRIMQIRIWQWIYFNAPTHVGGRNTDAFRSWSSTLHVFYVNKSQWITTTDSVTCKVNLNLWKYWTNCTCGFSENVTQ